MQIVVILIFVAMIALLAYDIAIVLKRKNDDLALLQVVSQDSSDSPTSSCERRISNPFYCETYDERFMLWWYKPH